MFIEKARRLANGYRNSENYRLRMLLAPSGTRTRRVETGGPGPRSTPKSRVQLLADRLTTAGSRWPAVVDSSRSTSSLALETSATAPADMSSSVLP